MEARRQARARAEKATRRQPSLLRAAVLSPAGAHPAEKSQRTSSPLSVGWKPRPRTEKAAMTPRDAPASPAPASPAPASPALASPAPCSLQFVSSDGLERESVWDLKIKRQRAQREAKQLERKEKIRKAEEDLKANGRKRKADNAEKDAAVESMVTSLAEQVLLMSLQSRKKKPRRTLTEEEGDDADEALGRGPASEVLVSKFKVDMSRDKLRCLKEGRWLNDEVINFYLQILQEHADSFEGDKALKVHLFNSFFFSKLCCESGGRYDYSNVKRWSRKWNFFEMDVVVVPINISNMHWTMAAFFPQEKRIKFYDSMGGNGTQKLQHLMKYVVDEWKDKKKRHSLDPSTKPDQSEWELDGNSTSALPQQKNGCDCGVFVCAFAKCVSCDLELDFSQTNMPFFRRHIALSIVSDGTLVPALPE